MDSAESVLDGECERPSPAALASPSTYQTAGPTTLIVTVPVAVWLAGATALLSLTV